MYLQYLILSIIDLSSSTAMVHQTSTVALTETVLPTANISSSSESVSDDKAIIHVHISYPLCN